ncbi:MAG: adenosylcobinamide-GDP ribazoletransferase [Desulfovibrionaceae bacterium]|nr:adenosylcobinamide-GDP ribazoletransferase [Desulfovibrionaceae bacterium]MBF0514273.1 adenosylcobinamide-GDP ribazoletransferase [Desulfovibrionaceae bacterium]
MKFCSRLVAALGFLSRLVPARQMEPGEMGRSLAAYPLAGAIVGSVAALPLALGLGRGNPFVQAVIFTALGVYLTRALHYDGLADVCDGWGSMACGERFWAILKDSRIGAFGVMALCLSLAAQIVFTATLCEGRAYGGLVFGAAFGRGCCAVLAYLGRDLGRPGLAREFLAAADAGVLRATFAWLTLLAVLLFPFKAVLTACLLAGLMLWRLLRLARDNHGLNGDFLGAAIVLGELCAYAGFAFTL